MKIIAIHLTKVEYEIIYKNMNRSENLFDEKTEGIVLYNAVIFAYFVYKIVARGGGCGCLNDNYLSL